MPYKALDVAKYIVERCDIEGKSVSNLKLQKILYFVQAEFLVVKGEPCFCEPIEAWDFGVVVPVVYKKYRVFGSTTIPCVIRYVECPLTDKDKSLVDGIIDECVKYSSSDLTEITLQQSPWKKAYSPYCKNVVTNESIKEFFIER